MRTILLLFFTGIGIMLTQIAYSQALSVKGHVTDAGTNEPLPGINVVIKNTTIGTVTDIDGAYTINVQSGQALVFSSVGYMAEEVPVANSNVIDINLVPDMKTLSEVVVTAFGIKEEKKNLGVAVTEVKGGVIAQSQRANFVDALQGRVAGITVNQSSGLPGASSKVVIRGISSISGSNEPLYVVDGLPFNNRTFNTNSLASSLSTTTALNNRGVDFTNRASDVNPEDIESITVLKGPEATSLYGLDASSGAIIITTKRGKSGKMRVNYSPSFSITKVDKLPEIQRVYGQGENGINDNTKLTYFGEKYNSTDKLYNNITGFFRTGFSQKHNLSVDGGTERIQYRLSGTFDDESGIIPQTGRNKWNLSSSVRSDVTKYLNIDFSMNYINDEVNSVFKGANGPMLGLLIWPSNDNAKVYLNPDGSRKTFAAADAYENPYFNVKKNDQWSKLSRINGVTAATITATNWLKFVGKFGYDIYSEEQFIVNDPASVLARSINGSIDNAVASNRNFSLDYFAMMNKKLGDFKFDLKLGGSLYDTYYKAVAAYGSNFLDPSFVSVNNLDKTTMRNKTTISQRRIVGAVGILSMNWRGIVNLQVNGRNDWASTLPKNNNSFFYPGANFALILSELPSIKDISWITFAKLRGGYAIARKDPAPYSIGSVLESQPTSGGGYAYGFTGPNPLLKPEKTTSFEGGLEFRVFNNRLGIDATYYKKESKDQITSDIRMSYATGFILNILNGGTMWNSGIELQLDGTPVKSSNFSWDINANFNKTWSELTYLPGNLTEFYISDTWFYGNVRNGMIVGGPTTTISGLAYLRNNKGEILISPTTGLPLKNTVFSKIGDRNPDFTVGLTNKFSYKNLEFSFLLDMRKGGDVFNGTEHWLTLKGLSKRTLNRETPVVVKGVLRDGLENSDNPTWNNIQVYPFSSAQSYYYTTPNNGVMNEEDFVEKDINWIRLKDVTLRYNFTRDFLQKRLKNISELSVFATATDLFIITNYTGLDPVIMGNNAAVGGSGSAGMDYGNLPLPLGFNFGFRVGF